MHIAAKQSKAKQNIGQLPSFYTTLWQTAIAIFIRQMHGNNEIILTQPLPSSLRCKSMNCQALQGMWYVYAFTFHANSFNVPYCSFGYSWIAELVWRFEVSVHVTYEFQKYNSDLRRLQRMDFRRFWKKQSYDNFRERTGQI